MRDLPVTTHELWEVTRFVVGLAVMTAATLAVGRCAGVGLGWFPLRAITRAAVQLVVLALLLRGVLTAPGAVAAFVALMLTTASWTAAGRIQRVWNGRRIALLGVVSGASVAIALTFGLGLVAWEARYVVALGGIVIGSAMTSATLSGRNFLRISQDRAAEVEAWLALGATPSHAHIRIGRTAVRESMLPTLDQSRSTGLVTLPGAFVGALFGGASPLRAAQFQLAVLAGIALCTIITSVVVTRLAGRTPYVDTAEP